MEVAMHEDRGREPAAQCLTGKGQDLGTVQV
jgi:hypothetical protein